MFCESRSANANLLKSGDAFIYFDIFESLEES